MHEPFVEKKFLPMSRFEMQRLEWDACDVILLTGDAYIDHPSYGVAIIARLMEKEGLRVGIIAQPNPNRTTDFTQLGKPNLFFGVTSGCSDSMVNNSSPTKRPRKYDNDSAGRIPGKRPDHAVVAYSQALKIPFPDVPVILGGIEASLRKLTHYDFFDDEVKMSALIESGADLLVYGQGEKAIRRIVEVFKEGGGVPECRGIPGVAWKADREEDLKPLLEPDFLELPDFIEVRGEKTAFFQMAKANLFNFDPQFAKPMIHSYPNHVLVINPPQHPLTTEELDEIYQLPYVRTPHPKYKKQGAIPAFETIKFSLMTHRGCPAGCSFCSVYFHQGRYVSSRSRENVLAEADQVSKFRYFRNVISNVGGPVGNAFMASCAKLEKAPGTNDNQDACRRNSCCFPEPCKKLKIDQEPYLELLKQVPEVEGVQKVFIASNFRYDFLERDPHGQELFEFILSRYTGRMLKLNFMHVSESVTRRLRRYAPDTNQRFWQNCVSTVKKLGLDDLEIVPYFIASHPGSTMEDALEAAQFMLEQGLHRSQIIDFVPMPGTASACMHYTGLDPYNDEQMYRPFSHRERKLQRALLHFFRPENARFVYEALLEAGRTDLIGETEGCLLSKIPDEYQDRDPETN